MEASDPVAQARDYMLGNIIASALELWRDQQKPWNRMSEAQQKEIVSDMTSRVRLALNKAVLIISSDARTCFVTHVKDVQFKEGKVVEAKLVMKNCAASHELADVAGGNVIVVIEDAVRYSGGEVDDRELTDPDQAGLPIE